MIASVIIPTFNRPHAIGACLDALDRQSLPPRSFEVIVVDDGSPRPLELDASRWADAFELTLIRQANAGPAAARNRGVQEARSDYLAFTDDDCCPEPEWLAHLLDEVRKSPDALVGGTTDNELKQNAGAEVSQMILELVYQHFNADIRNAYFFTSNNMACRKASFWASGGFDADFPSPAAEDREFCDRWRMHGKKLIWRQDAHIKHRHAQSFAGFMRLHFRYGVGAFLYQDRRKARNSGTMQQDMGFHRTLPRRVMKKLRRFSIPGAGRTLIYLLAWQITNTAGFIAGWISFPRSQRPLNLEAFRGYSIVVQRRGGAGNQLFQYAAARQAARQLGSTIRFTPTDTQIRRTDIQLEAFTGNLPPARARDMFSFLLPPPNSPTWVVEWNRRLRRKLRIGRVVWKLENGIMEQIERSFLGDHLLFDAYFQGRQFFHESLTDVLDEIARCRPGAALIDASVIALNLRTGDDFQKLGWTNSLSYFEKAVDVLDPDRQLALWLIGDEPDKLSDLVPLFAKTGRRVALAPAMTGNRQLDDFWNMARAGKLVMSRSTYCWWAAAMNDHLQNHVPARIMAPDPWLPARARDIIPTHWIKADAS